MIVTIAQWIAFLCCAAALLGWWKSKSLIRHEAIILPGIAVYFGIGTLNLLGGSPGEGIRYHVTADVWIVVGAGMLAYMIGAILGRQGPAVSRSTLEGNRPEALSQFLAIIGWMGLVILLIASKFPLITGANREDASGYLTGLALFLVPAFLLRFAARWDRLNWRDWAWLALACFLFLQTGYRSYTLVLGLSVAALRWVDSRSLVARIRVAAVAMLFVLTVGVGFGYLRFTRYSNQSLSNIVAQVQARGESRPDPNSSADSAPHTSTLGAAAAYTYVGLFREGPALLGMLIERQPDVLPYGKGHALVGMLTSPLPGEQEDARGIISREVYGRAQTSLVSTIFGPWYLDFGIVGVIIALALMGFLLSWLERRAIERGDVPSRAAYAFGLVIIAMSIHSGLSDFSYMVLIPLLFVWAAARRRILLALRETTPATHQPVHH